MKKEIYIEMKRMLKSIQASNKADEIKILADIILTLNTTANEINENDVFAYLYGKEKEDDE